MRFLKNVRGEIKQATWPNGKQLHKNTLIIIETSIIFGLMFYVTGTVIQSLLDWILKQLASRNVLLVLQ